VTAALPPEDSLVAARRAKLERLRAAGDDPFPPHPRRTHTTAEVHAQFDDLERGGTPVAVAGRLSLLRVMGKASFAEIRDGDGRLQVFLSQDGLGPARYALLKESVDLGDHIGVEGPVFRTRTGEETVRAQSWTMLSKALRPPPEKWHGLTDVEQRLRFRHLDLISNPDTRELLAKRSAVVREIRRFLDDRGFVEIETPVLQALHGGAAARPFLTHYNALDRDVYLRISLELYLKRLLIGGFDKVYEIGRNFRNEGLSRRHSPEFTMLETYEAYADYRHVMQMTEALVITVAQRVLGTLQLTVRGQQVDLTPPWPRISHRDAVREQTGIDYAAHPTLESLWTAVEAAGLAVEPQKTRAQLIDQLQATFVEPRVASPVFLVDYPVEMSPLAKLKPGAPDLVERFEAFAAGIEIGNAFTELNDPDEQLRRFLDQARQAAAGDEEAHTLDTAFIEAMQHGMPPAGGLGIGIDRLCMFLFDVPQIREVIAFPMLREP
jgi:lysyl-tRNA synthetase class 2